MDIVPVCLAIELTWLKYNAVCIFCFIFNLKIYILCLIAVYVLIILSFLLDVNHFLQLF
jgi:hypothetical protein